MTLYPRQLTAAECNRYIDSENYVGPMSEPARRTVYQQHPYILTMAYVALFWIASAIGFWWLGVKW